MNVLIVHPGVTPEHLGLIPYFLNENDPRPAREQFDANYSHGGGWRPQNGFKMLDSGDLKYPGDPAMPVWAETRLRDEVIHFYQYGYVAICQGDGSFEVCRMD